FRLNLEAYGLARDADGPSRYRVEYEWQERETGLLERLWPGRRRSAVAYERATAPADGLVAHAVTIRPAGLPPGEYTLAVRIRDLVGGGAVLERVLRVRLLPWRHLERWEPACGRSTARAPAVRTPTTRRTAARSARARAPRWRTGGAAPARARRRGR